MTSCQCQGIEQCFNPRLVTQELDRYRKKGASKSTRRLIAALEAQGVTGMTLLDIGGGVGAIPHALLQDGVSTVTAVDASTAYLNAARDEAQRRGLSERIQFEHGNFVDLAPGIAPADIPYDPSSNTFTVHDPARSQVTQVSAAALENFMAGNAGAMGLWK